MPELLQINTSNCNPLMKTSNLSQLTTLQQPFTIIHHQPSQQHMPSQQQQQQQHNHNTQQSSIKQQRQPERTISHKRPSSATQQSSNDIQQANKRVKSNSQAATTVTVNVSTLNDTHTSPHLLQQLMAPTPQQRARTKASKMMEGNGRWTIDTNGASGICGSGGNAAFHQQSSNSVLHNLLVSGCDISAGYVCFVPMRPKKAAKA